MMFTHADVNELVALLESCDFDELSLETGRFTLHLQRDAEGNWHENALDERSPQVEEIAASAPQEKSRPVITAQVGDRHAVRAPLMGTFYRAPSPGAAPFVEEGQEVAEDTVIGIVETMKLMNSLCAGINGTLVEICVPDAEYVEQDAVLMLIEPRTASSGGD